MSQPEGTADPLRNLTENLFDTAGYWRLGGLAVQIALFAIGFGSLWFWEASIWPTIAIALLTVAYEIILWWSNRRYGQGQSLQRTLDLRESFGWEPTENEIRDFTVRTPSGFKKLRNFARVGSYFASKSDAGPRKALENLIETSWWSKHLCEKLTFWYGITAAVLMTGSVLSLIWSVANLSGDDNSVLAGKAITSVILLIFSLNTLRLFFAYQSFGRDADRTQAAAENRLKSGDVDVITSLRMWSEYQSLRNSSPPIPGWAWNIYQKSLNEIYAGPLPKG